MTGRVRRLTGRARHLASRLRPTGLQVLGVLVVMLTLLGGVQTYRDDRAQERTDHDLERVTDCLRAYGDRVAEAIDARTRASDDAQQALDTFLSQVLVAPSPADARALFETYVGGRSTAKAERDAHPYPPPPRVSCPG